MSLRPNIHYFGHGNFKVLYSSTSRSADAHEQLIFSKDVSDSIKSNS